MPEAFIEDPNVALKWKLYAHLNGFWISGKTFYARNDTLAKIFNKSERSIQSALSELEGMGLITRNIKGLSRYILPGGIKLEGRSPASPTHEAQLHLGGEAQLHHSSDSSSDSILTESGDSDVEVFDSKKNSFVPEGATVSPIAESGESVKPRAKPDTLPEAQIRSVFDLFSKDCYGLMSKHKPQREAVKSLLQTKGMGRIQTAMAFYRLHKQVAMCPNISKPYDLASKWDDLLAFKKRNEL